jgi:hypothetical protein
MSFEIKYDRDGNVLPNQDPTKMVTNYERESNVDNVSTVEEPSALEDLSRDETSPVEEPAHDEMSQPEEVQEKVEPVVVKKSSPQESWKILREKAERAERRAAELEQAILDMQSQKPVEPEEDLSVAIEDDSLVEGKHLSKVSKKIQNLEKQLRQYEQQSALTATEARLKQQYPDFDRIVSAENLANLRAAYPEIAHTLNSSSDLYSKAVSAYTMIKRLGIAPEEDIYKQDKSIAQKNAAKPRSLASISPQQGDSPLSRANAFANGLSDDLKSQLWKEMNQYRK